MCNDKLLCYNNDGLPTTLKAKEVVRMNNNNSLSHTTWNCKYHIVFAPKYRRKVAYGKLREDIPINRYKYHGTFSLPFFKTRFYNLDVSTEKEFPVRHTQLNMMISSDMRNSYALRRAADAPGTVRIGLMG